MNNFISNPCILKHLILLVLSTLLLCVAGCRTTPHHCGAGDARLDDATANAIIAMEKAALDRWCKGDPSGFLEISAPDVVYFDPFVERRLDGLKALTDLYEGIRGKIFADNYELVNPKVQLCGDAAVLTFNFVSVAGGKTHRWNCTEVYRRTGKDWRIIQSHWSLTKPKK